MEDKVVDDELEFEDVKINPDLYIHKAITNVLNSRIGVSPEEGFLRFWSSVEELEVVVRASGRIGADFEDFLKNFRESEEFLVADERRRKNLLLNKRFEYLLSLAFDMKPLDVAGSM